MTILERSQNYTYRTYFEKKIPVDELAMEFGYGYSKAQLSDLPIFTGNVDLNPARRDVDAIRRYIQLSNEQIRREMLIAPLIREVVYVTEAQLRVEYPVNVTDHLKGNVDYLLRSTAQLVVIEAKNEDLEFGFTQLAAELIGLDQWQRTPPAQSVLIGAVTTGLVWRFGRLERSAKLITEDLNLYRIPDELEPVLRFLIGALSL